MDTVNLPKTANTVLYWCAACGRNVNVFHGAAWPGACVHCGASPFAGVIPRSGAIVSRSAAHA